MIRLILSVFFIIYTSTLYGQRVVNKIFYIFPAGIIIDTLKTKDIKRFVLSTNDYIKISNHSKDDTTKENRLPVYTSSYFTLNLTEIRKVDSLMKINIRQALRQQDSAEYFKSGIYTWPKQNQPGTLLEYLKQKEKNYFVAEKILKKLINKSDRYYLGYFNKNGDKKSIVLFDAAKVKWNKGMQALTVNLTNNNIFFTMPGYDYYED